jgi:hypothetical protein
MVNIFCFHRWLQWMLKDGHRFVGLSGKKKTILESKVL